MIPYGRQEINQSDIDAVINALQSDYITQGPRVDQFERAVAAYCDTPHAVAVNNGTAALTMACNALGVNSNSVVWTSTNTFTASANCARSLGARIGFVDVEPGTFNMCPNDLQKRLEQSQHTHEPLPDVVIPVHFAGHSCDMQAIHALSIKYGFKILEDACHAIGGRYEGKPVGHGHLSDITAFSFHPVKHITTGEGGMAVTRDSTLYEKMQLIRTHGITRDPDKMINPSHGPWYYEQILLGTNYRITDIQTALGISQLKRLDDFCERRRSRVARYRQALAELPLSYLEEKEYAQSAWHLFVIQLDLESISLDRRTVFEKLREAGIGVNVHYIPVHLQPYYHTLGFNPGDFPVAEHYYQRAITLPLFPGLSEQDQDTVINALKKILA
ncbi:MAG: UDP-4-amino-4,6-dideoxy-N-acetyl-beta-L-altrosamine transaminase [Magnetococcales bacterium]|nr:UDP-4-amino-4,6-dideoxy-N-acetyl-beta-L-altrosamine transaminase [Magnetococcales bacterium]